MKVEYDLVIDSALHPDMMIAGMVVNLLFMSLYGFIVLLSLLFISLTPALVDSLLEFTPRPMMNVTHVHGFIVLGSVFVFGVFCAISVFVFRTIINTAKIYLHVRFFKEYVKSIPDELRDSKLEMIVIYAAQDRAVPGLNLLWSKDINLTEKAKQDDGPPSAQNLVTPTLPEPPAPAT